MYRQFLACCCRICCLSGCSRPHCSVFYCTYDAVAAAATSFGLADPVHVVADNSFAAAVVLGAVVFSAAMRLVCFQTDFSGGVVAAELFTWHSVRMYIKVK